MHPIFWRWITWNIYFFLSSAHSPLHHSIRYEFSHRCCPSQGIFPPRPSNLLYCSLATTDLLVGLVALPLYATYWMSLVQEHWSLCRYAFDAAYITGSALFLTSLMTMTAISVDRLLALLLGLRYKQIVTLKRTYIIVATIWILALVSSLCALLDDCRTFFHRLITIPLCLVISLASYTNIFRTLRYHQVQAEDPVQQQPSQLNLLNIAQYRKAV